MVAAGADLCLTFIDACTTPTCRRPRSHGSHGSVHCAAAAHDADIPVRPIAGSQPRQPAD